MNETRASPVTGQICVTKTFPHDFEGTILNYLKNKFTTNIWIENVFKIYFRQDLKLLQDIKKIVRPINRPSPSHVNVITPLDILWPFQPKETLS